MNLAESLLETVLYSALERSPGAKEVLLKPDAPLRLRTPRGLIAMEGPPLTVTDIHAMLDQFLQRVTPGSKQAAELRLQQDGAMDIATTIGPYRLRANFYREAGRLSCTMRCQPRQVPDYFSLGAPNALINILSVYAEGLLLVTGPIGTGKTTTLAAATSVLANRQSLQITTAEQPIEYQLTDTELSSITQREVPSDVPTFAKALEAAKRQGTNVFLCGEMRDGDTTKAALDAASAGMLVMATGHSASAHDGIHAVLSHFGTDAEKEYALTTLGNHLLGILTQRLVPSVDRSAWVLAYEFLPRSPALAKRLRDGSPKDIAASVNGLFRNSGSRDGTQSLNSHLSELIRQGRISIDAAMQAAYDRADLKSRMEMGGDGIDWA
jgi:twitching motility protein PilT